MAFAADAITVLSALLTYELRIVPRVRAELADWQARAAQIPDETLRATALAALAEKSSNVAATAVFAILAPRRERAAVLRAIVALQAAIDYLDSLGEVRAADPLADGLALHGALRDAVSPGAPAREWYRHHPQREDGGYLAALVGACQEAVALLPGREAVLPALQGAAAPLRRRAEPCACRGLGGSRGARGMGRRAGGGPRLSVVGAGGGRELLGGGARAARRGRR